MTYDQKIYAAVNEAQQMGLTTGAITFPMINMIATTMAAVVTEHRLNPEDELEVVRHQLDELYTRYLQAYRKQPEPSHES